MGIGAGTFLIALGAVLAFAVSKTVNGIDIPTVGVILMLAGALSVVLDLMIFMPRRRTVVTTAPTATPVASEVTRTTTTRQI